ncbi:MAG: LCP family protein [Eubacteriales bacterium]|jgi:LCP family protein required for cell wall assembly|nr:LCP family protein [Eubacteriales bacterium]
MARTPDKNPGKGDRSKRTRENHSREQDQNQTAQNEALPEYGYHGMEVEPFVPTDVFPSVQVRSKHRHTKKKKRALWVLMLVGGIVLLAVGGVFAYALLLNPSAQFVGDVVLNPTEIVSIDEPSETAALNAPTPTPTLDPYEVVSAQADTTMMQNIVNVLLIGVDYAKERETWSGKKEYHADVMMVVAINFDENRADLISLPRDTYAEIPGVKGIYKLNASINCGGGFDAPGGAGFLKTCEAASWMLGGIPVNYYYAVTMPAVKELVDAFGGVDYNLDVSFKMMGRSYSMGPTHLNGQGVLDYLRVRKNVSQGGDLNRVNRQKEMLIAIFESMQKQNLILKVPDIISSFSGQLFTNCTLGQTAALTKFAYSLDKNNIGMHSIGGSITNIFNWNFCLTDQTNRVKIIEQVYGIEVPRDLEYTADYAQYRWADIIATQYLDTTRPLVEHVSRALAEDDLLPTMEPTPEFFTPIPEYTPEIVESIDPMGMSGTSDASIVRLSAQSPIRSEGYQRYSLASRFLFDDFLMSLDALEEAQAIARKEAQKYVSGKKNNLKQATQDVKDYSSHVKTNALQLAQEFGYSTSKFLWTYWYDKDSSFNEVRVDFN